MDDKQRIDEGLRELALFAGAGGGILGGKLLGWRTVCAVEREPYAASVLMQRQNDGILDPFPVWDDVCDFDGRPWRGLVDVVSGGFPCQDISVAGKGAGLDGERSGLWSEMARIIGEVRPRFVFVENSPMLAIRGGVRVIADLASMGYVGRWGALGGQHAQGYTQRQRMWIFASASSERCKNSQRVQSIKRIQELEEWRTSPFASHWPYELCSPIDPDFSYRKDNGLDTQLDRIKAIGNGQVPAVAKLAWETLTS